MVNFVPTTRRRYDRAFAREMQEDGTPAKVQLGELAETQAPFPYLIWWRILICSLGNAQAADFFVPDTTKLCKYTSCTILIFQSVAPQGELLRGTPSFVARFLPAALGNRRPPVAPSFVARRKIGEKGVPKGSKAALWILAFIRGFGGETCGRPTCSPGCN